MTSTLRPTNFLIVALFLLIALALLMPQMVATTAPTHRTDPRVAAIMHIGGTESVTLQFIDYPEQQHENDCGLTVYLRIMRRLPNNQVDPCTIIAISWQELFGRASALLKKQGIEIELPNGLSKDVIYALGQREEFRKAVELVLNEIAKSQGLGANIDKIIGEFPFDAFWH